MEWWRVFRDRSGRSEADALGPRRRLEPRFDYQTRLTARCDSWPGFIQVFTGDVSRNGLFVPTTMPADLGERVRVDLELPDGSVLVLTGLVASRISEDAARHGGRAGLGVHLDPLTGEARAHFDRILDAAMAAQPRPESSGLRLTVEPQGPRRAGAPTPASGTPPLPGLPPKPVPSVTGTAPKLPAVPRVSMAGSKRLATSPGTDDTIVGIDLGTTYTSVAAVRGNKVMILERDDGARSTPSVIAFPRRNEVLVGAPARDRMATDPARTVHSPKRLLGRAYTDREVQTFVGQVPYRTFAGPDGTTVIDIWQTQYAMPQLVALLFEDIKKVAERALATPVSRAVVSVPITFDETRILALRRAAQLAGIDVVSIVDEPSAAALANRFDPGFGGVVGVYDFGGGTFDFSIVDVSQGDFRVVATAGDTWLGGDDFDSVLAEAAANQFWRQHKVDLRKQAVEWQKLLFACERAKRTLGVEETAVISVPGVLRTANGMVDLSLSIDRPTLARAASAVIQRSITCCTQALKAAGMRASQLSNIYLSGGTTYLLAVREALVRDLRVGIRTGVPPEHAVCLGAAIQAAQIQLRRAPTLDER